MKLSDQLLKAAEFEPDRSTKNAKSQWTNNISPPNYDEYFSEGADWENARLIKLIKLVAPVLDGAEQLELNCNETFHRLGGIDDCDPCKFKQAIAKAREEIKCSKE